MPAGRGAGHNTKQSKPNPDWLTYRARAGRYRDAFPARSAEHAARQFIRAVGAKLEGEPIIIETPRGNAVVFNAED